MSELNYLEKLLNGVGVEWKPIGTEIKTVTAPSKLKSQSYRLTGRLPIIDQGLEFIAGYTDEDVTPINNGEYIIFGDHSEHIKYVDFPFVQGADGIKILRAISANTKYIYYAFLTFYTKELSYKRHWSTAQQTLIPIPCPNDPEKSRAIQSEIVRILDTFTTLTAELTAELTARKKQYNYYRDQLLSFNDCEVEWKTLKEIGTWYGGGTPSKARSEFWEKGSIPWISPKDMGKPIVDNSEDYITEAAIKESSTKLIPANSIAIVVRSSILDKYLPSALIPVPATFNQDMKIVITHGNILPGFIAHMLRSRGNDILRIAKKTGGSVASIDSKKLFSFRIPIPKQYEQQRITNILDKFDTLANSLTEGLPREIGLRQKQYEYYRDLLFSFPKPESVNN
ncbi:restriction endonuclease subunit S [Morganella morganii]|uniref:restriction endonuclease subunit S n=1 Tax=Morganella morganii TaxID=582 RepID=UPI00253FF2C7|nr:restriction endonuclease subunit S [Morganella morganii]MDK3102821.1 restriction endonuclease subunit S [Morganella morganii]